MCFYLDLESYRDNQVQRKSLDWALILLKRGNLDTKTDGHVIEAMYLYAKDRLEEARKEFLLQASDTAGPC